MRFVIICEYERGYLIMLIVYSLIFTVVAVIIALYPAGILFQLIFYDFGIEVAMFATIIFTIVFCTQIIINKIDSKDNDVNNSQS